MLISGMSVFMIDEMPHCSIRFSTDVMLLSTDDASKFASGLRAVKLIELVSTVTPVMLVMSAQLKPR